MLREVEQEQEQPPRERKIHTGEGGMDVVD